MGPDSTWSFMSVYGVWTLTYMQERVVKFSILERLR